MNRFLVLCVSWVCSVVARRVQSSNELINSFRPPAKPHATSRDQAISPANSVASLFLANQAPMLPRTQLRANPSPQSARQNLVRSLFRRPRPPMMHVKKEEGEMATALELRESGNLKAAEDLLWKVVKSRTTEFGTKHPDTLASSRVLASTLKASGKLGQAEEVQWNIYRAMAVGSGIENSDTLASADDLVETMKEREHFSKAARFQRKLLKHVKQFFGPQHPETLTRKNSLSITLRQFGDDENAEELQEEILAACQPWLDVNKDSPFARFRRIPVFGYGSNNIMQICERCQDPDVPSSKGYLPNYKRVFVGYSKRWGGAPASVERQPSCDKSGCRGTLAWLTDHQILMLDQYEGCRSTHYYSTNPRVNVYRREKVQIEAWVAPEEGKENSTKPLQLDAWVYMKNSRDYASPSDEYLDAVVKNIGEYWQDDLAEELPDFLVANKR